MPLKRWRLAPGPADPAPTDGRRPRPIRAHIDALVTMFVDRHRPRRRLSAGESVQGRDRHSVRRRRLRRRIGRPHIDQDLASVRSMVSGLAANQQVTGLFTLESPVCALEFSGAGAFTAGHLDFVAADGRSPALPSTAPPPTAIATRPGSPTRSMGPHSRHPSSTAGPAGRL